MSGPPGGREPVPPPDAGPARPIVEEVVEPATVGDLRSLRRWLLVTGVWAVAATAIAVIALVAANDESENRRTGRQIAQELARVQTQLNERIDDLESRIDELPSSEDLGRLDARLGKIEETSGAASDSIERLSGRLEEAESSLDDLEREVAEQQESAGDETSP